jgi:hypothetical protein
MLLSAKENEKVLKLMEDTINKLFKKKTAINLAKYMGGELTVNPPKNEKQYQESIKDPMEQIFSETKHILEKKLKLKINNKVYQPINKDLYFGIGLYGRYGNFYFNSNVPDTIGENANSYKNSPLQQNTISGNKSSDGSYSAFNGNTFPSQMKIMLSDDPNIVGSSVGFVPLSFKRVGYRACRKLINDYTGIVGGVLIVALYNVNENTIANLHN